MGSRQTFPYPVTKELPGPVGYLVVLLQARPARDAIARRCDGGRNRIALFRVSDWHLRAAGLDVMNLSPVPGCNETALCERILVLRPCIRRRGRARGAPKQNTQPIDRNWLRASPCP